MQSQPVHIHKFFYFLTSRLAPEELHHGLVLNLLKISILFVLRVLLLSIEISGRSCS